MHLLLENVLQLVKLKKRTTLLNGTNGAHFIDINAEKVLSVEEKVLPDREIVKTKRLIVHFPEDSKHTRCYLDYLMN